MSGQPIDDGGPAFPAPGPWTCAYCGSQNMAEPAPERLRDHFAGEALAGLMGNEQFMRELLATIYGDPELAKDQRASLHRILARRAYLMADAMLVARAPKPEPTP